MTNNPYVVGSEGRKEWNDRYMNMAKSIKNWQITCLCAFISCVILALVVARLATTSRVAPYVIDTNHGMPYAIQPLTAISVNDERIVNYVANQFIVNARTVLADPDAEKLLLDKVYAYSGNGALNVLHDYYLKYNPLNNPQKTLVDVSIVNSMPLGKNIWQVVWDETKRNQDGSVSSQTRWMADLTYQFGEVNSKFINDNPFGLFITNITWSQSVGA